MYFCNTKYSSVPLAFQYVPPKPGQNGWRAPKKSDVISSIPPPSSGPTPTPLPLGMRELSPPLSGRQTSPTRSLGRHTSPPIPSGGWSLRASSACVCVGGGDAGRVLMLLNVLVPMCVCAFMCTFFSLCACLRVYMWPCEK